MPFRPPLQEQHLAIAFAAGARRVLEFLHGMVSVEWSGPLAEISLMSTISAAADLACACGAASDWRWRGALAAGGGLANIAWFIAGAAALAVALSSSFRTSRPTRQRTSWA